MIDVTTNEFKQQIRNRFFSNTLVTSGIVQVVDEPLQNTVSCTRYQTWKASQLDQSSVNPADRIGEYVSRRMTQFFMSVFAGVAGPEQLPEDKQERDNYRVNQLAACQTAFEQSDHTIALIPSFLEKSLVSSYHLCPFTQKRIPSFAGKQLVRDDSPLQPYLFYPGEVKVFFRTPGEIKVDLNTPDEFSYWWEYEVSVNGFEYCGNQNPANNCVDNPDNWKRTTEKSRILRVG
jgi:hypothetical protein